VDRPLPARRPADRSAPLRRGRPLPLQRQQPDGAGGRARLAEALLPRMNIPAERLERWAASIFEREGVSPLDAALIAKVLVWANLRGMDTHGVVRVPRYVDLIRDGDLNPRPAMTTRNETAACVLLEADRAAGPVAMTHGTELAIQKARGMG